MKLDQVAKAVRGIPIMTAPQGRAIYEHVIRTSPSEILELGTANGVSACYMAAALEEVGSGHITTLDRMDADYGSPQELFDRVGLQDFVTVVARPDSSYNWYLREVLESRSDAAGNCEPLYDLCYLDGAHEWTIDGFAVILVEKLMRPGGWLLLDDLTWTYAGMGPDAGKDLRMSESERSSPHIQAVFDLIVRQIPNFTDLKIEPDLDWGWARKAPDEPRRLTLETNRSLGSAALLRMREAVRRRAARQSVA